MTVRRLAPWLGLGMMSVMGCSPEDSISELVQSDNWSQAANNKVDILWVIDDSGSMAEEQDALAEGFVTFANQLESSLSDFHMGVISTSFEADNPDRGLLRGDPAVLTADVDYRTLFAERAVVGIAGADKEKGLEAAAYALSPSVALGANSGFLRPEAELLVIFISDEEDCSDNFALEGQASEACYLQQEKLVPVGEFVKQIRSVKSGDSMVQLAAIIGIQSSECSDAYIGQRYKRAVDLTGGRLGDICNTDWTNLLGNLGLNATGIRESFRLSRAAKPGTLKVFVGESEFEEPMTEGWTYDESTWMLHFEPGFVPERGSRITAEYVVQPGVLAPEDASSY